MAGLGGLIPAITPSAAPHGLKWVQGLLGYRLLVCVAVVVLFGAYRVLLICCRYYLIEEEDA